MNRRNFIRGLLTAAAGFTILPPATTYSRIWRAQRPDIYQCHLIIAREDDIDANAVAVGSSGYLWEIRWKG